jgi:hypothetical protein
MADYRAYVVGDDGHFVSFEGFVAADDGEAVAKAQRLVDGHDVELWSGGRFVIRLETPRGLFSRAKSGPVIPKK